MRTALYVAQSAAGVVKVGVSVRPMRRRKELEREFRGMSDELVSFDVAGHVSDFPRYVEWKAKLHCGFAGGSRVRGTEWFASISGEEMLTSMRAFVAQELAAEAARNDALPAQLAMAENIFRALRTGELPQSGCLRKLREEALQPDQAA